jgi:uncharacterized protein (DUF2336 family)
MNAQSGLITELEEVLANGSAEKRTKTLLRVADLFVFGSSHFSGDHVAVFDEVLSRLVSDVEQSARAMLASRLAAIPNAPPIAMRKLASDDAIEVAGPVLTHSDALDNTTLIKSANAKGQEHLLAISRRKFLAETVTDVLIERGNRDVALSAAQNAGAKFSEIGFIRLVKRSENDDELAQSVGARPEIPRHHFLKLLSTASKSVRLALENAHPQYAGEIKDIVAEVATAIQEKAAATSRDYAAVLRHVESIRQARRLGEGDVEMFARTGKFEEMAAALAILANLSIEAVERAIVQDRADSTLILAKAIGLSWPTTKAVLRLRAGRRGLSPQALEQHMADFSCLKRETAQRALEFQRKVSR